MAQSTCITWENFIEIHYRQFLSIGLPERLWKSLYNKLAPNEIRDAGSMFELRKGEGAVGWSLHTKSRLMKDQDVYLIDHAWTSDGGSNAKKTLLKNAKLVKRLQNMMCLNEEDEDSPEILDQEIVVQELAGVDLDKAEDCLNKTKNDLIQALVHAEGGDQQKTPNFNLGDEQEKKVLSYEEFKDGFTASIDEESRKCLSEEFMKKMFKKYLKDSEETANDVRYGEASTSKYSWNETDEGDGSITVVVSVPSDTSKSCIVSKVSPQHWTLGVKGGQTVIDGEFYSRIQPDECYWTFDSPGVIQMTLQKTDPSEGLWPFLIKGESHLSAQQIYDEVIEKDFQKNEEINCILRSMWYYNQVYQAVLVKGGPQQHLWYIMDEVGSALMHSSTPNIRCAPFAYAVTGTFFSLIWPVDDINKGEVCSRNFCPILTPGEVPSQNEARLLACLPEIPEEYPRSFLQDYAKSISTASTSNVHAKLESIASEVQKSGWKLSEKFYVDEKNDKIKSILSSLGGHFVNKLDDATAVWIDQALPTVNESQKVNYLSGDDFLTRRDVLSRMINKKLGEISWYPMSFNLRSQLAAFCVKHYMKGLSAIWIIRSANPNSFQFKPVVSSDLRRIIRLAETGPLVASEFYVTGALSHKKHFVLQYSVVVSKLKPLQLLIHNTPNIRKTPKPFDSMAAIDEYNPSTLLTTTEDITKQDEETFQDFVKNFEKNYSPRCKKTWAQLQETIYTHILELFMAVLPHLSSPGNTSSHQHQTNGKLSAVYGVDVIVMEDMSVVVTSVDSLPSFANDQVAKEVLYVMYADQDSYKQAGNHVTLVTSAD